MADNSALKGFVGGLLSNAVWEWIKAIAGGTVTSLIQAVIQYYRHQSVDWWGIVFLALCSALLIGLLLWRDRKVNGSGISTKVASSNECAEKILGIQALYAEELRRLETSHNSAMSRAGEVRDQAEAEGRKAAEMVTEREAQLSFFTPLQLEAFQLAKDIDAFLGGLGLPPSIGADLQDPTLTGVERALSEYNGRLFPDMDKRLHGFQKNFGQRAEALLNSYGEKGIHNQSIRLLNPGFSQLSTEEQNNLGYEFRMLALRK